MMCEPAAAEHRLAESAVYEHRERLWALAYRMLGSPHDADDAVQETFLRWHRATPQAVRDPEAWLVTAATRICVDRLRARKVEQRLYVGPWLPTPTLRAPDPAPDRSAELASELSIAFLLLLERLNPEERAAFLLREVFDASYADVAAAVGKTEQAARQMVHRARQRVRGGHRRFKPTPEEHERIVRQFADIMSSGDADAVRALLDPAARLVTDGGGKVWAARRVISGAEPVARGLVGAARKGAANGVVALRVSMVNGEPAVLSYLEGRLISITALEITQGRIRGVYRVLNPEKLRESGLDCAPPPGADKRADG